MRFQNTAGSSQVDPKLLEKIQFLASNFLEFSSGSGCLLPVFVSRAFI